MDYSKVRNIPLRAVLHHFEIPFKKRVKKEEWFCSCPIHGQKSNTSFSFTDRVFNCFSCGVKGAGAIDFVMAYKKIGFREAVELLSTLPVEAPGENKPVELNYEKYYIRSEWLKVGHDILQLYGVGEYSNPARKSLYSGQVMFPVLRYSDGAKVGYVVRRIRNQDGTYLPSDVREYLFPRDFIKHVELFGAYQLKMERERQGLARLPLGVVVPEPLTVLELRERGILAVSPFGDGLSSEQAAMVSELFERVLWLLPAPVTVLQQCWVKAPALPVAEVEPLL